MQEKRKTRSVRAGEVIIGGGFPPPVQTMWKEPLPADPEPVLRRLEHLAALGCRICRFSVPDGEQAERLNRLAETSPLPLVADIHFDHTLALKCLEGKVAKIRINPGNIGASWKTREVIERARDRGVPIRIGINGGSLPASLRKEGDKALAMVKAAEEELELLAPLNFHDVVFSLKSSGLEDTVRANEIFAERCDYPLHLGVTEAGSLIPGIVKSSVAFYRLLSRGIGDTIRVSLADSPENEVLAGKEILRTAGFMSRGISIVSCPRCGRATFDGEHRFLRRVTEYCETLDRQGTIAVMGCVVNGPGEARDADLGISGVGNQVIIYRSGQVLKKVEASRAWEAFKEEIDRL